MQHLFNQSVLITTSSWFFAPDGQEYRAVWGTLKGIHEAGKTLGFIPNRSHANWFIEIGGMVIMGCQVMYVIACPAKPNVGTVHTWKTDEHKGIMEYDKPTSIYISQE